MKKKGFNHFVGIDGSSTMLEGAKKTGLYKDLKQCILGKQDLPAQRGGAISKQNEINNNCMHDLLLPENKR